MYKWNDRILFTILVCFTYLLSLIHLPHQSLIKFLVGILSCSVHTMKAFDYCHCWWQQKTYWWTEKFQTVLSSGLCFLKKLFYKVQTNGHMLKHKLKVSDMKIHSGNIMTRQAVIWTLSGTGFPKTGTVNQRGNICINLTSHFFPDEKTEAG